MGMNHINGRIQDAVTGRFLSADPKIPHSTNPQSYNRYSYVSGNPLTLIDPSGYDDYDVQEIGGGLGNGGAGSVDDFDQNSGETFGNDNSVDTSTNNSTAPQIQNPYQNTGSQTPGNVTASQCSSQGCTVQEQFCVGNDCSTITRFIPNPPTATSDLAALLGAVSGGNPNAGIVTGGGGRGGKGTPELRPASNKPSGPSLDSNTNTCVSKLVRVAQGVVGVAQAGAGLVQAIGGLGEAATGVAGLGESVGASAPLIGWGIANVGYGLSAILDGGSMAYSAWTGSGDPASIFAMTGQQIAGDTGAQYGTVISILGGMIIAARNPSFAKGTTAAAAMGNAAGSLFLGSAATKCGG
jgi:hypothetical protein